MIRRLLKYFKYLFRKKVLRKKYISYNEFVKRCKQKSKDQLVEDIIVEAANINKNNFVNMGREFKRSLRNKPKKVLIDTLACRAISSIVTLFLLII